MFSFLGDSSTNTKKKIKKRQKKIKKGGKEKVDVTHVSIVTPSYIYKPNMWTSLIIATLVAMGCGLNTPMSPFIHHHSHSTYSLKDFPWTFFPLRGWEHFIRLFIN